MISICDDMELDSEGEHKQRERVEKDKRPVQHVFTPSQEKARKIIGVNAEKKWGDDFRM